MYIENNAAEDGQNKNPWATTLMPYWSHAEKLYVKQNPTNTCMP
jgi:hypothetical protein